MTSTDSADIVVVGAGMAGLCASLALAEQRRLFLTCWRLLIAKLSAA